MRHIKGLSVQRGKSFTPTSTGQSGFFRTDISFVFLLFVVAVFGAHIYSVNMNAVQGYHIGHWEKEIANLQEENARLKIQEADTKSFQRIEAASGSLALEPVDVSQYFEERDVVASR